MARAGVNPCGSRLSPHGAASLRFGAVAALDGTERPLIDPNSLPGDSRVVELLPAAMGDGLISPHFIDRGHGCRRSPGDLRGSEAGMSPTWIAAFGFRCPGSVTTRFPMAAFVYILASRRHGPIYVGCTSDLPKRICEHREGLIRGFARQYRVKRLVFSKPGTDVSDAALRERRIDGLRVRTTWMIQLVEDSPAQPRRCSAVHPIRCCPGPRCHPGESRDP